MAAGPVHHFVSRLFRHLFIQIGDQVTMEIIIQAEMENIKPLCSIFSLAINELKLFFDYLYLKKLNSQIFQMLF